MPMYLKDLDHWKNMYASVPHKTFKTKVIFTCFFIVILEEWRLQNQWKYVNTGRYLLLLFLLSSNTEKSLVLSLSTTLTFWMISLKLSKYCFIFLTLCYLVFWIYFKKTMWLEIRHMKKKELKHKIVGI